MRTIIFVKNINNSFDGIETPLFSNITGEIKPIGKIPKFINKKLNMTNGIGISGNKVSLKLLLNNWIVDNIAFMSKEDIINYMVYYDQEGNILDLSGNDYSIGEHNIYDKEQLLPKISKISVVILNHSEDIIIDNTNYKNYIEFVGFIDTTTIVIDNSKINFTIIDINEYLFKSLSKLKTKNPYSLLARDFNIVDLMDLYDKIIYIFNKSTKLNITNKQSNYDLINQIDSSIIGNEIQYDADLLNGLESNEQIPEDIYNATLVWNGYTYENAIVVFSDMYDNGRVSTYVSGFDHIDFDFRSFYSDYTLYATRYGDFKPTYVSRYAFMILYEKDSKSYLRIYYMSLACNLLTNELSNITRYQTFELSNDINIQDYVDTPVNTLLESLGLVYSGGQKAYLDSLINSNDLCISTISNLYPTGNNPYPDDNIRYRDILIKIYNNHSTKINTLNVSYRDETHIIVTETKHYLRRYDRFIYLLKDIGSIGDLISQINKISLLIFNINNNFELDLINVSNLYNFDVNDMIAPIVFKNIKFSNDNINIKDGLFNYVYPDDGYLYKNTLKHISNSYYNLIISNQIGNINFTMEAPNRIQIGKMYKVIDEIPNLYRFMFIYSVSIIQPNIYQYNAIIFYRDIDYWRTYAKELFNLG